MKLTAREKIIATGVEMVGLNGFNATGVDSVLKAAGVPKGSFYHHFGTKENFGMEVINLFAESYEQKLKSYLGDESVQPLDRIRNYMEHSVEHLAEKNFTQGCLIGNLGQELADQNERFRDRLAEVFADWMAMFTDCLGEAQEAGALNPELDPEAVASFLLSGWEGAILRAKVMRSSKPLRHYVDTLFATVLVE
ncbi:TetR family transcriptional regulator C-terminal domain-containing protein [Pseudodesulfovibrio thermohalotolerans]|jgi:TetR/AcrR family transcriptional repressor of nem operon|uniref:TetR/AcrR family transcriptional regulator n=1 Tax=Pseudodesulfovibrio thermohalotolerans TaxID=2880651 RepID=UPI0022BA0928|nr:TetR/AcrR family transcriptional regulator [Pseudodesulfovibrio thermohalotolerans]WFS63839.1 TetR family transcriptional regulator C-terminal domain-containing protein [Pseudodesulfovibrio thermohalotolerans]